ncbi:unnamed protein product [Protopolystoma xenopodis]|uniref:Uncharacterized protein n=1 Tax=Protopolystoma xenopodis TaxID=117903 RepID=A0A3S5FCN7_9PLAT|nr:unnamed protein product [Protopolystoma xenopodis]
MGYMNLALCSKVIFWHAFLVLFSAVAHFLDLLILCFFFVQTCDTERRSLQRRVNSSVGETAHMKASAEAEVQELRTRLSETSAKLASVTQTPPAPTLVGPSQDLLQARELIQVSPRFFGSCKLVDRN